MGLILRLTEMNGYETASWILEAAGLDAGQLHLGCSFVFRHSVGLTRLAQLANVEPGRLRALTYPPAGGAASAYRNLFFGRPVPKYVIRLRHPKVCPACLSESAYCRRMWELALVTACPIHRCILSDECPCCRKRIRWVRKDVSLCPCGFDWRATSPLHVEDSELEVSKQVYRLCGQLPTENNHANGNPLYGLGIEHLVPAISFVASQYKGIMDTKGKFWVPSSRNAEIHILLNKAFSVFEDWPHNYFSFLDWRRAQDNKVVAVGGLTKDFGNYGSALFHQLSSPAFDFLRDTFDEYLSTDWKGGYASSIKRLGRRDKKYVSRFDAAAKLRMTPEKIDDLITCGKLKGVIQRERKKRRFLVETSSIEQYGRELDDQIGLSEVTRLLKLSPLPVLSLVEHECLRPLRGRTVDQHKKWKFSRKEVKHLLLQIEAKVDGSLRGRASQTLSVGQAVLLFRRFKGLNTGWFVRSILDGNICPSDKTQEKGLAAFRFAKRPLVDYSRKLRRGPYGHNLGLPEVAESLGLERNFAYTLVREGILRAEKAENSNSSALVVSKQSVKSFASTYRLLTKKDAQELGTSTHSLVILLAERGVEPITGKGFGVGRYYLYEKAELEKIDLAAIYKEKREKRRQERKKTKLFNSSQTAEMLGVSVDEVNRLVEIGLLSPYRSILSSSKEDANYYFTPYVITIYKKNPISPAADLVSTSVAAGMLNESRDVFYERWVRTECVRPALFRATKGKLLFYKKDIKKLSALKNRGSKFLS